MVEFVNPVSNKVIDVSGLPQDLIASAPGFTMCQ